MRDPRPGSARPIFWLMTFGAIGAILGPWLAVNYITALGIVIYQVATVWLLVNMMKPLRGTTIARTPGLWHVITACVWQVAVVLGAPLIALLYPGFSPAAVEQTAPQLHYQTRGRRNAHFASILGNAREKELVR
jgi:hypothetical protein